MTTGASSTHAEAALRPGGTVHNEGSAGASVQQPSFFSMLGLDGTPDASATKVRQAMSELEAMSASSESSMPPTPPSAAIPRITNIRHSPIDQRSAYDDSQPEANLAYNSLARPTSIHKTSAPPRVVSDLARDRVAASPHASTGPPVAEPALARDRTAPRGIPQPVGEDGAHHVCCSSDRRADNEEPDDEADGDYRPPVESNALPASAAIPLNQYASTLPSQLDPARYEALQRQISAVGEASASTVTVAPSTPAAEPGPATGRKRRTPAGPDSDEQEESDSESTGKKARKAVNVNQVTCDFRDESGKVCGTVFQRLYDLSRHKDTKHGSRGPKPGTVCDRCGKSFSRKDAMLRHKRQNKCSPEDQAPTAAASSQANAPAASTSRRPAPPSYVEHQSVPVPPLSHAPYQLSPSVPTMLAGPLPPIFAPVSQAADVPSASVLAAVRAAHAAHATKRQPDVRAP